MEMTFFKSSEQLNLKFIKLNLNVCVQNSATGDLRLYVNLANAGNIHSNGFVPVIIELREMVILLELPAGIPSTL